MKLSRKKFFILTLLGYIIIGASSSGFYQQRYFHEEGLTPLVWVCFGFAGGILLLVKNILGSNNNLRAIFFDLCLVLPAVLIPLIPARHDVMLILMLLYVCAFIIFYVIKNYKAFADN